MSAPPPSSPSSPSPLPPPSLVQASLLSQLQHPNIVSYKESFQDQQGEGGRWRVKGEGKGERVRGKEEDKMHIKR